MEKMRKMMQEVRACQSSQPGPRPLATQAPPGVCSTQKGRGNGDTGKAQLLESVSRHVSSSRVWVAFLGERGMFFA